MTLSEEQRKFAQHVGWLLMYAYSQGLEVTFGHAWRSPEEQKRLVAEGKSQTMKSKHLDRLAVDFNLFKNGKLTWKWEDFKILGDYWEKLDPKNRWGGDWNKNDVQDGFVDAPHFERHLG